MSVRVCVCVTIVTSIRGGTKPSHWRKRYHATSPSRMMMHFTLSNFITRTAVHFGEKNKKNRKVREFFYGWERAPIPTSKCKIVTKGDFQAQKCSSGETKL